MSKGFTLIEMVVVIVILAVIAITGSVFLQEGLNVYFTNQSIANASTQARITLETMTRRIREIRSLNAITVATATQLTFADVNNNTIDYQFSGTNLLLNGNSLMTGLNSATSNFSYLDENANATTTLANIRYVVITLVIAENNVNYTLRTVVYPRNIV